MRWYPQRRLFAVEGRTLAIALRRADTRYMKARLESPVRCSKKSQFKRTRLFRLLTTQCSGSVLCASTSVRVKASESYRDS